MKKSIFTIINKVLWTYFKLIFPSTFLTLIQKLIWQCHPLKIIKSTEVAIGDVLLKKVFLNISKISQENSYLGASFY